MNAHDLVKKAGYWLTNTEEIYFKKMEWDDDYEIIPTGEMIEPNDTYFVPVGAVGEWRSTDKSGLPVTDTFRIHRRKRAPDGFFSLSPQNYTVVE